MKFEIDRGTWCRGSRDTALVRKTDGHSCCLGFFMLACGVEREKLVGEGEPQEVYRTMHAPPPDEIPKDLRFLIESELEPFEDDGDEGEWSHGLSYEAGKLIELNDNSDYPEDARERDIAAAFAKHGHEAVFVGPSQPSSNATKKGNGHGNEE